MPGQTTERYATVTISRQMGCLGHKTAKLVGEMLGYRVFWREVINEAARRAGESATAGRPNPRRRTAPWSGCSGCSVLHRRTARG